VLENQDRFGDPPSSIGTAIMRCLGMEPGGKEHELVIDEQDNFRVPI